jgi:cell wall integrity and stress response component
MQSSTPDSNPASSDSMLMTWVPTPITSVETVTGQVRTVTTTPTSPPTAGDNSGAFEQMGGHGLHTGQVVGLTIGLVALVAIIGGILFFCVRKRRQSVAGDQFDDVVRGESPFGQLPKRTMSETSRYMLGTDGRQVVEGWEPETEVAGSRRSRLIPVDPRLDPFAPVYRRGDGSKSQESVATIRDDHDYSRRFHNGRPILRATNPDE